jgi:hypothetical protein
MSATTYSPARSYFADVSNAARAFASALFAAEERQFVAQEVALKPAVSLRAKEKSRLKLFALARDYEHVAPSLSAELRLLASRG